MAFQKRTWLARIGIGLNKFIIGEPDENGKQTITNAPDTITQQGDVISASNLNDLEDRIADGFDDADDELTTGLAGKQNTLTFDNAPTEDSNNPVKSGGVYTGLAGKQATLVSGANIKTVDGQSILGSGDISVGAIDKVSFQNITSGGNQNISAMTIGELKFVTSGSTTIVKTPTATGTYYVLYVGHYAQGQAPQYVEDMGIKSLSANTAISSLWGMGVVIYRAS